MNARTAKIDAPRIQRPGVPRGAQQHRKKTLQRPTSLEKPRLPGVDSQDVHVPFPRDTFKESDKILQGASMPGVGYRFSFVGKVPFVFWVLLCLLFLNTFLMLFLPKTTVGALRWYGENSITIQFVLLALTAVVVIIFRKRIHWEGQK